MALRSALDALPPETVFDLETAGRARLWDAWELAVAGRNFPAIYLGGYAAEMLLKAATFRLQGAGVHDAVWGLFGPAKVFGQTHFPSVPREASHSVVFWQTSIVERRKTVGKPCPGAVFSGLMQHSLTVYDFWSVAMRYRDANCHSTLQKTANQGIETFLAALAWIDKNHHALWS